MKESKRVVQAIATLDMITQYLHYYMGDCPEFRQFIKVELHNIEGLLKELAVDQKLQNIKLAQKLRKKWAKELEDDNEH